MGKASLWPCGGFDNKIIINWAFFDIYRTSPDCNRTIAGGDHYCSKPL